MAGSVCVCVFVCVVAGAEMLFMRMHVCLSFACTHANVCQNYCRYVPGRMYVSGLCMRRRVTIQLCFEVVCVCACRKKDSDSRHVRSGKPIQNQHTCARLSSGMLS
jgi:hypothetical protein